MNYGEKNSPTPKEPEHIEISRKMAEEIIQRFSPSEQNDCLKVLHEFIKGNRQREISELQDKLEFLKKSIDVL